jgi:hypothetical protein
MDLARLAGLNAIRLTTIWKPGQTQVGPLELTQLQNSANAANLDGIRIVLSMYQWGGATTPRTPAARLQFALWAQSLARGLPSVHDYIVGNEPNLNRFWMPQFGANGSDVAARDYEALLASTYDALKAVNPAIRVIGGSVSPHGGDDPHSSRQTHSPSTFIPDMGRWYRASHRTKPIMDAFSLHPYEDSSKLPPTFRHPRSTTVALADYKKLVRLLTRAYRGTHQRGATLPILYDEFGVQTAIPSSELGAYTDLSSPAARDAVPESKQGAYYSKAIRMAYCQRNVMGLLMFHVSDEPDLAAWQSGVFYANDQPKASLKPVHDAAMAARDFSVRC